MHYTNIFVTGGAGFIGCNLVRRWLTQYPELTIHVVDKLTYAGNLASLREVKENPNLSSRCNFIKADICDWLNLATIFGSYMPQAVIHLAAESHVDRSIDNPHNFIQTNIVGTQTLLHTALQHYRRTMPSVGGATPFRFIHVSTDEVYGNMHEDDPADENYKLNPTSPYAASKAASDLLALSYFKTFQLPVIVTRACNNYGPYQYPEKFIPTVIINALQRKSIPLYGDGLQVREWMHVDDHCDALMHALVAGLPGEIYNIGDDSTASRNWFIADKICLIVSKWAFEKHDDKFDYRKLVELVADRPAHDTRYAMEYGKAWNNLHMDGKHWQPHVKFDDGLQDTVHWYLNNQAWVKEVLDGKYNMERQGVIK
jgi:dTDP-glucose 4,6-dehydratase